MLSEPRRERERQVLCSLLLDESACKELPEDFAPDCFEDPDHREMFEMLSREFIQAGRSIRIPAIQDARLRSLALSKITTPPVILNGLLREAAYTLQDHDRLDPLPEPPPSVDPSEFPEEMTGADIQRILSLTIQMDAENKTICFLAVLSMYTEDSQYNVLFNAPSSTGKSFIALEVVKLFPSEDVRKLAGATPTSFLHSGKWEKDTQISVVDLERKCILFLEQPNSLLLQKIRSFLSHDDKVLEYKITDKRERDGLRTKTVQLRGHASVIFCSANLRLDEQEATRCFLLSPESNQEKIHAGVLQKLKKESDPEMFALEVEADPERRMLKARIRAIKAARITEIKIPPYELELLERNFLKVPILKPRAQRDVERVIDLVKAYALLNLWHRDRDGGTITVNESDVNEGLKLWDAIADSQEAGLPPYLWQLYREIILRAFQEKNAGPLSQEHPRGLTRPEILKAHLRIYGLRLSLDKLRSEILPQLEAAGLIFQEADPEDRKVKLVYPTTSHTLSGAGDTVEGVGGYVERLSPAE